MITPHETTPHFEWSLLFPHSWDKESIINAHWMLLDALLSGKIHAFGVDAPPDRPKHGMVCVLGAKPSAPWDEWPWQILIYVGYWHHVIPRPWMVLEDEGDPVRRYYRWLGGAWKVSCLDENNTEENAQ